MRPTPDPHPNAGPDRLKRASYSLALAGLAAVILALSTFSAWSALQTNRASSQVESAVQLSDSYLRARYALSQQESIEREYWVEPEAESRHEFDRTARELVRSLLSVRAAGDADDVRLADRVLMDHARYRAAVESLFVALAMGDEKAAHEIDEQQADPLCDAIEGFIDGQATAHNDDALQRLRDLRRHDHFAFVATIVAFALGLALVVLFGALLLRVHRKLQRHARQLNHAALHDPLTCLPNRALFGDRLAHAVRAAGRDPAPFSLMMVDLDRFKEINDTLGHSVGDQLLQAVGPRLEAAVRCGDTVARLGGDEFAMLLPGADGEAADEVAGRVLDELRKPFSINGISVSAEASVGVATYPTHGHDAETLLQRVDVAMYIAKQRRGDKASYDPQLDPFDPARRALAGELRGAIERDEFELHYQPKFDTETLKLAGVEALVRWRHPERGLMAPDQFIGLAERTGSIRELTRLVLEKAVRQVRGWNEEGFDVSVAVNLSVANLLDSALVRDIAELLEREGVGADRLELEITETMLMTDPERATELLDRLSAMGIRISIDDFGTGYSSLAYMRRLPVSEIKIDRSFVRHLAVDEGNAAIVRSTIDLSHSLNLMVVAKGVEDARSLDRLRVFGCDRAQGFHLGRPVPARELLMQLRRRAAERELS